AIRLARPSRRCLRPQRGRCRARSIRPPREGWSTRAARGSRACESQSRVDGLALEGEHAEDTFVNAVERFAGDEAFERFDAERELAQGERALVAEPARTKARQVRFGRVLGSVDDAEVLGPAALDAGLGQALRAAVDGVDGLAHPAS